MSKNKVMISQQHFIGIDVSKKWLDVYVRTTGKHFQVNNDKTGFDDILTCLQKQCLKMDETLFCFENTGMYSTMLARFMENQKLAFIHAHPLDIKLSGGAVKGKNDKIDSIRLAEYAYKKREELTLTVTSNPAAERLRILFALRQKLVKDRAAFITTRNEYLIVLKLKADDSIIIIQEAMITELNKQIKQTEQEIKDTIASDAQLCYNYKLLLSVCGIGPVVATAMIMYTGNFTKFSDARKFCSYCGFVPYDHQSGSSVKKRRKITQLANKEMKSLIDRGALSTIEHDEDMKQYYQRKLEEGKKPRVIINAVRCKIVYRAFSVIKTQRNYIKKAKDYKNILKKTA